MSCGCSGGASMNSSAFTPSLTPTSTMLPSKVLTPTTFAGSMYGGSSVVPSAQNFNPNAFAPSRLPFGLSNTTALVLLAAVGVGLYLYSRRKH